MPILARCANPACGLLLVVGEEFAHQASRCPRCQTVNRFVPAEAPSTAEANPDGSQAELPLSAVPPPQEVPLTAWLLLILGLLSLALTALATMLPWQAGSGVARGDAVLLLQLCLALLTLGCAVFFVPRMLRWYAQLGAAASVFLVLVYLAEITYWSWLAQAGLWLGFAAASGAYLALLGLAYLQPRPWASLPRRRLPLWWQRHGGLLVAQVWLMVLGVLYWLVRVWQ